MAAAGCNSPYGAKYHRLIREWLDQNGLDDIDSHERRGAVIMAENEIDITVWRQGLSEVARLRANHPNTIVMHWRKRTVPQRSGPKPKPHMVIRLGRRGSELNRPMGDTIKRCATALGASGKVPRGADCYAIAVVAIEALTEDDIIALLKPKKRSSAQSIEEASGPHVYA